MDPFLPLPQAYKIEPSYSKDDHQKNNKGVPLLKAFLKECFQNCFWCFTDPHLMDEYQYTGPRLVYQRVEAPMELVWKFGNICRRDKDGHLSEEEEEEEEEEEKEDEEEDERLTTSGSLNQGGKSKSRVIKDISREFRFDPRRSKWDLIVKELEKNSKAEGCQSKDKEEEEEDDDADDEIDSQSSSHLKFKFKSSSQFGHGVEPNLVEPLTRRTTSGPRESSFLFKGRPLSTESLLIRLDSVSSNDSCETNPSHPSKAELEPETNNFQLQTKSTSSTLKLEIESASSEEAPLQTSLVDSTQFRNNEKQKCETTNDGQSIISQSNGQESHRNLMTIKSDPNLKLPSMSCSGDVQNINKDQEVEDIWRHDVSLKDGNKEETDDDDTVDHDADDDDVQKMSSSSTRTISSSIKNEEDGSAQDWNQCLIKPRTETINHQTDSSLTTLFEVSLLSLKGSPQPTVSTTAGTGLASPVKAIERANQELEAGNYDKAEILCFRILNELDQKPTRVNKLRFIRVLKILSRCYILTARHSEYAETMELLLERMSDYFGNRHQALLEPLTNLIKSYERLEDGIKVETYKQIRNQRLALHRKCLHSKKELVSVIGIKPKMNPRPPWR